MSEEQKKGTTYADAGVNVSLGDKASKIFYGYVQETWENRKGKFGEVVVPHNEFRGVRGVELHTIPLDVLVNTIMGQENDGVGTKVELAERIGFHDTVAYDLLAMVCDDPVVYGAEPIMMSTDLNINTLGKDGENYLTIIHQLGYGLAKAARQANMVVVGGETAELGIRVGGYGPCNYNWSGTTTWLAQKDRMITGEKMQEGDTLVALREDGFRSNGLSLVRKTLSSAYGDEWHEEPFGVSSTLGICALTPSTIYCKAVTDMTGGFLGTPQAKIHGMAHITGGGLGGRLAHLFKGRGLGAVVMDPFEPSPLMLHCQEVGNIKDREAYSTWNMRHGVVIVTPEPEKVMEIAARHNISSKDIGCVTSTPGVRIRNKGYHICQGKGPLSLLFK